MNNPTIMAQCKDCAFGQFKTDEKTGARLWQGVCVAGLLTADGKQPTRLKYHTVMQHFQCSNGKFKQR